MSKALIILKREYLTRIQKKSFIIMTFLFPVLMIGFMAVPAWLMSRESTDERTIAVFDESGLFDSKISGTEYTRINFIEKGEFESLRNNINDSPFYAILYLPKDIMKSSNAELFSKVQVTMDIESMLRRQIENTLETIKKQVIIDELGVPDLEKKLAATRTRINLSTQKIDTSGQVVETSSGASMAIGYVAGFLIYMFMFMYGSMVMQGVMEEKTTRIAEVIISSVKPHQLMFGKIIGVGLVGLTQIAIWIFLVAVFMSGVSSFSSDSSGMSTGDMTEIIGEMTSTIGSIDIPLVVGGFLFFFIAGFLFYSALMGAMGAAVDTPEETQQFMMPLTLPLILAIVILFPVMKDPESSLAFWTSIIPFTSPVIMIARIPFGVPVWELLLSMGIMIVSIFVVIRMAAKIYRIGILMYGKKVNYKEIVKWLRYKN